MQHATEFTECNTINSQQSELVAVENVLYVPDLRPSINDFHI